MMQQKHKREGIAILSVVVVLSTLLIIGVLFAMTVELDLKANKYYREAGRTEMIALEGLYRAIGEIQYDMWGVYEDQAFRLANHGLGLSRSRKNVLGRLPVRLKTYDELAAGGDELAQNWKGDAGAVEAAYFRAHADGQINETKPIVQPISKWRQSIEDIGPYKVMTDWRWMVKVEDTELALGTDGEAAAVPRGRRRVDFTSTEQQKKTLIHSGGMFYDEFLPEHTDNNDGFELGLHLNRGDVYFRNRGYAANRADPPRSFGPDEGFTPLFGQPYFWAQHRTKPWDRQWDYIDTRINGDSFYKIFRTELVYEEDGKWFSNYAGVWSANHVDAGVSGAVAGAPMPKALFFGVPESNPHRGRTHTGNATTAQYQDDRGGAVNINQVNNNYTFENYAAYASPNPIDATDYTQFHYRDSKWIFVYNEAGSKKVGRYAVMVWPDCGTPNANYLGDDFDHGWGETTWAAQPYVNRSLDYFRIIDAGYTPHGSPMFKPGERMFGPNGHYTSSANDNTGVDIIRSSTANAPTAPNWTTGTYPDFANDLAYAISEHVRSHGPVTSRVELIMAMTKYMLPQNLTVEERMKDAELITNLLSVHAYENFMGPHWEADRLIIDALGYQGSGVTKDTGALQGLPHSFVASADTRKQIWNTLDQLRFYWGLNDEGEGRFTPYHYDPIKTTINPAATTSKSMFLAWCASGNFTIEPNSTDWGDTSNAGWAYSYTDEPFGLKLAPKQGDITEDEAFALPWAVKISEVGRVNGSAVGGGSGDFHFIEVVATYAKCTNTPASTNIGGLSVYIGGSNATISQTIGGPGLSTPRQSKQNHVRGANTNRALFLIPTSFNGNEVTLTRGTQIADYVKLPGQLSEGWSCQDFLANQHPKMWQKTGNNIWSPNVDPGNPPAGPGSTWATPFRFMSGERLSGVNANSVLANIPGGEALPTSYLGYGVGDADGTGITNEYHAGVKGFNDNYSSWVAGGMNNMAMRTIGHIGIQRNFDSHARLLSVPLGFPPVPMGNGGTAYPDPRLRIWMDLMRHAPAERYFTTGFLHTIAGEYTTTRTPHYDYIIYDSFDNNMNGQVDELTDKARVGDDWDVGSADMFVTYNATGHSKGHYMGDRASLGRVNLNEIAHPAVAWYICAGVERAWFYYTSDSDTASDRNDQFVHYNLLIGKKPFKGYTSWADIETRASGSHRGNDYDVDTNSYNVMIWYENLFADGSAIHSSNGGSMNHLNHTTKPAGRFAFVGNSPVYTIYVTAQSLDVFELPLAEVKVMGTIERTWDGKLNMLDFKWLPSDVRR